MDDLAAILDQLRAAAVDVVVDPQQYPNGRFATLRDPEGNPIQLWQPVDPTDTGDTEESLAGALAAERETLDPDVRRDAGLMAALLADDFTEIGASGGCGPARRCSARSPRARGPTARNRSI